MLTPSSKYHCREGSRLATLPRPDNLLEVFLIIPRGVLYGCGDLIFLSHMIFSLVFVQTYQKYGTRRYTVNLVVFFVDNKLPEMPDRSLGVLLLPLSKDSRTKEEGTKLMNGNSGDPIDRLIALKNFNNNNNDTQSCQARDRGSQANGKVNEENDSVHVEVLDVA
ncbi:hypothetical protein Tco_1030501 [Tanacetum coccineum]|uniref:Sphingomyelin synthase-like domain-containing protein n=1 Tax=Tanacetum coccineum TaxID=301880 RepID=A0ABQ5G6V2_9ASTR